MGTLALIGLGSNLGDRKAILDGAICALEDTPGVEVRAVSSYRETAPVGGPPGQGPFLNAAATLDTSLDPVALHSRLHEIEHEAGRIRHVRWGERTLDLDLLLFGQEVIETDTLTIPHPRFALRRFVLAPLAEIAPETVDPVTGRSIAELLENLDRRPSYVALSWELPEAWWLANGLSVFLHGLNPLYRDAATTELVKTLIESEHGCADALEPLADLLAETTRSLEPAQGGWIVTDLWFDELYHHHRRRLATPRERLRFREWFLSLRCRVPEPTFVVVNGLTVEHVQMPEEYCAAARPLGSEIPWLRLEDIRMDPASAGILAACAATRTG